MLAKILITDLDNTVYDWVDFFVPAFQSMVVKLSQLSGISLNVLIKDFAEVFRRHNTVEYSFAIEELSTLEQLHPNLLPTQRANKYWEAVRAFQKVRRFRLRPYAGLIETFQKIKSPDVRIYGLTTASIWPAGARLKQLGLDHFFDGLYGYIDVNPSLGVIVDKVRKYPIEEYQPQDLKCQMLPKNLRKPSPELLKFVVRDIGHANAQIVYVGDSLVQDVAMAKAASVVDVWARYGTRIRPDQMRTLLSITPWSASDVRRSLNVRQIIKKISPTWTIDSPQELALIFNVPTAEPSIQTLYNQ